MTDARVDIILPAYNGREVIAKAIDSAFAQRVPFRLIVVDDGSDDDSADIARSYGERVEVIRQGNRGVSGARNTGLAHARAPYVALLDQDDIWKPGKLERQLAILDAHPEVGIVFCDMTLLTSDGTIVEDGFLRSTPPYAELAKTPIGHNAFLLPEALAGAVVRFNFISPSTAVLRRDAVQDVGGFDEAFRLCDDAECWMRLLKRWRGAVIEENLVLSLVWEGNASRRGGELIGERLRIGEKAAAQPQLYAAGTIEHFRRERPLSYYQLGVLALNEGDAALARRRFAASFRDRPSAIAAAGCVTASLPAPVRSLVLKAKRATGLRWNVSLR
jgi:glycosyltransferase involved in cell wall biosynthesis